MLVNHLEPYLKKEMGVVTKQCKTVNSFLETSIQARIFQLNDEYGCNDLIYEKFQQQFKEFMEYIPDSKIEKYLDLEDLFHRKLTDAIEFIYRAAAHDMLMLPYFTSLHF